MLDSADNSPRPTANETRGLLLALAIIPIGIIAWGILWKFGFIASIVGFVVAFGAMYLYRLGAGGRVTRLGAALITAITLVTLGLAFFGGMVLDGLEGFSEVTGESQLNLFFNPQFWDQFFVVLNQPGVLGSYTGNFMLALLFGALGCFQVIRSAFREASAPARPAEFGVPSTSADASVGQPTDADTWPSIDAAPGPSMDAAPWPSIDATPEKSTEPDAPRH